MLDLEPCSGRSGTAEVDARWSDLPLLVCFFVAGLIDSVAFDLYSCFVNMQTGNTIFIGLGVSGQPDNLPEKAWLRCLLAIIFFAIGTLFFSSLHRWFGPRRRWVLITSFLAQAISVGIVALLVTASIIRDGHNGRTNTQKDGYITTRVQDSFPWSDFVSIALLAFQSAGQAIASRALGFGSLPTIVLTSLYCDLMSDAELFTASVCANPYRNRRVGGIVLFLAGAVTGGFLSKSGTGFSGTLWIASSLKLCISFCWCTWKSKL
ncbi:hypothetical protein CEP53_014865 [Fusarium sp. AF-6]|nr:hypothetical protein CEP53_014865 [Fusarium sp. AF-6]